MTVKCSVQICERPAWGKGWCQAHYMRVYSSGDLRADEPLQKKADMGEPYRYYCSEIRGTKSDECLKWPFAYNSRNKAVMKVGGKQVRVHRFGCREKNGPPPTPSHHSAHNCGHDWCINPNHTRWATASENNQDKLIHGTHNRGERHNLAKLTEEQVKYIRLVDGKFPDAELAGRFGISERHIRSICAGRSWAWLDRKAA